MDGLQHQAVKRPRPSGDGSSGAGPSSDGDNAFSFDKSHLLTVAQRNISLHLDNAEKEMYKGYYRLYKERRSLEKCEATLSTGNNLRSLTITCPPAFISNDSLQESLNARIKIITDRASREVSEAVLDARKKLVDRLEEELLEEHNSLLEAIRGICNTFTCIDDAARHEQAALEHTQVRLKAWEDHAQKKATKDNRTKTSQPSEAMEIEEDGVEIIPATPPEQVAPLLVLAPAAPDCPANAHKANRRDLSVAGGASTSHNKPPATHQRSGKAQNSGMPPKPKHQPPSKAAPGKPPKAPCKQVAESVEPHKEGLKHLAKAITKLAEDPPKPTRQTKGLKSQQRQTDRHHATSDSTPTLERIFEVLTAAFANPSTAKPRGNKNTKQRVAINT